MTLDYYPWWLDKLADDVTGQGAFIDGGPIQGPEAVRSVVTAARGLYEFQDFSFTVPYGIDEVRAQIDAARLSGAKGYMLWNADCVYTDGALAPS